MSLDTIIRDLEQERQRIDAALFALVGPASASSGSSTSTTLPQVGNPSTSDATLADGQQRRSTDASHQRRRMPLESREKISNTMKQNWAAGGTRRTKVRTLSQSVKDKISASQKARWNKAKSSAAQAGARSAAAA